MKQYVCRPKKDRAKCIGICIALIVLSAVAFFLSTLLGSFRALGQGVSVVCLLFFVQLSAKYLLTDYLYILEEDTLFIVTRQGKREKSQGGIRLVSGTRLFTADGWEREKSAFPLKQRFSYCQNLSSQALYYLAIPEEDRFVLVALEPDETLLALLQEKIPSPAASSSDSREKG